MNRTHREIRSLRKEMRAARRDIDRLLAVAERESRIDDLITEMQRSARKMLLVSRAL